MSIPIADQKKLLLTSVGICAVPECRKILTVPGIDLDRPAVLGEMAHIVAEQPDGPRGESPLTLEERNRYENLILLCNVHHEQIDAQVATFTVDRLHAMKEAHEGWVRHQFLRGAEPIRLPAPDLREDQLFTCVLPVHHLPAHVFGFPWSGDEATAKGRLRRGAKGEMAPLIVRGGWLFAFSPCDSPESPFYDLARNESVERFEAAAWMEDPDHRLWYIALLNRALNKLTGRRGLQLDKQHRRYFFPAEAAGEERSVAYTSLNRKRTERSVVWQPARRRDGAGRKYWLHRAVSLSFREVARSTWTLSLCPGFHVTADGIEPYPSDRIGSVVTRRMARRFNYDVLGDLQFWRDFLCEGQPRMLFNFGGQYAEIDARFVESTVKWPGLPTKDAKTFENVEYADDLFSWGALAALRSGNYDAKDEEAFFNDTVTEEDEDEAD